MIEENSGHNANISGRQFEYENSLERYFLNQDYNVIDDYIVMDFEKNLIGTIYQQRDIIKNFIIPRLSRKGIDYFSCQSKEYIPDETFISADESKVFIFEKKEQHSAGSVDEKLQTAYFKKFYYDKIFKDNLDMKVCYSYILSDWFKQERYNDVFQWLENKCQDCYYFFGIDSIPLDFFMNEFHEIPKVKIPYCSILF